MSLKSHLTKLWNQLKVNKANCQRHDEARLSAYNPLNELISKPIFGLIDVTPSGVDSVRMKSRKISQIHCGTIENWQFANSISLQS